MEIIIITGPPFSGKGTQCSVIIEETGYVHISTGSALRAEKEKDSEIGKSITQYETKGELVPDSTMKGVIESVIKTNQGAKGIILDGYPRTVIQFEDLMDLVKEMGISIGKVINIVVSKSELLKRAAERATTSDRADDKDPKIHIKRIEIFEAETSPAILKMKEQLNVIDIDAMGAIHETQGKVRAAFS